MTWPMPLKIVSGNFINVKLKVNSCNDKESYYIYPGIEFRLQHCNMKVLNYKKTTCSELFWDDGCIFGNSVI